jgi:hypothetical protein
MRPGSASGRFDEVRRSATRKAIIEGPQLVRITLRLGALVCL